MNTNAAAEREKREARNQVLLLGIALGLVLVGLVVGGVGACVWISTAAGEKHSIELMSFYGAWLQGTTGSWWALAGVIMVYATFVAQRAQNAQQNEEIAENRRMSRRQAFEGTFFQLFGAHVALKESLRVETGTLEKPGLRTGSGCFGFWMSELRRHYEKTLIATLNGDRPMGEEKDRLNDAFEALYASEGGSFGHYLRSLYHLFRFLERTELVSAVEKKRYADIVRAQLGEEEMALLFYNGLSGQGAHFRRQIVAFNLMKHVLRQRLLDRTTALKLPAGRPIPDHLQLYV